MRSEFGIFFMDSVELCQSFISSKIGIWNFYIEILQT